MLLGIGWENENMVVINFKKREMNFENREMYIIAPLDPSEGWRYIKPMKEEFVGGWHNTYNVSEDYIHPTTNGEIGWWSTSSASSDSKDALKNWKNRLHVLEYIKPYNLG